MQSANLKEIHILDRPEPNVAANRGSVLREEFLWKFSGHVCYFIKMSRVIIVWDFCKLWHWRGKMYTCDQTLSMIEAIPDFEFSGDFLTFQWDYFIPISWETLSIWGNPPLAAARHHSQMLLGSHPGPFGSYCPAHILDVPKYLK